MFGVLGIEAAAPEASGFFEAMAAASSAGARGRLQRCQTPAALLGVVTHRTGDGACAKRDGPLPGTAAWLGAPPFGREEPVWATLAEPGAPVSAADRPPFAACFVAADGRARVATDAFGLQPVYWAPWRSGAVFATRVALLLRGHYLDWRLDAAALLDLFTYEHVTGARTLAEPVRVLGPGDVLEVHDGTVRLRVARDPLECRPPVEALRLDEVAERMHSELVDSVRIACSRAKRVGVALSGGLDSRAILGCALASGCDLRALTFGAAGSRDVPYARALARRAGIPHGVVELDASFLPRWLDHAVSVTDGAVGALHFHVMALADAIRGSDLDLLLDGLGGDALTGGHLDWPVLLTRDRERAAEWLHARRATACRRVEHARGILEPDLLDGSDYEPRRAIARSFDALGDSPPWWGCHRFDLRERQRRFIQFGPHQLRPFVRVETPFYAPSLVSLLTSLPASHLAEQRAYLRMHRRHLGLLASVPDARRGVPVAWPDALRFAKRSFDAARRRLTPPLPRWLGGLEPPLFDYAASFRGPLATFLRERLLDARGALQGVVRRQTLETLVAEHQSGQCDHSPRLGCLLALSTWLGSLRGTA